MQLVCEKCGQLHQTRTGAPSCAGHRKHDGEPCPTPPVTGADKCRMHLGKKAGPVIAEARLARAMATYGLPIETSPADALLAEVHRTAGHVKWLGDAVADLEEHDLIWGTTQIKTGSQDGGTTEAAAPHVLLKLYQQERDRLIKASAEAIRCGIEERRVKLAESQGALVAGVIRAILGDLSLSPEQQAMVSEIVPRRLRELAA